MVIVHIIHQHLHYTYLQKSFSLIGMFFMVGQGKKQQLLIVPHR